MHLNDLDPRSVSAKLFECLNMVLESIAIILLLLLSWMWTRNFNYWKERGIPGPAPSLIFGNTKSVFCKSKIYSAEVMDIYREYRGKGFPLVGFFTGRKPYLLALDSYIVKEIMIKNFGHFADNEVGEMLTEASDPIVSQNPFFQRSQEWKVTRKELVPGFTGNKIKSFYPIMKSVCGKLSSYLESRCGEEVDMDDVTGKFTLDMTSDVIFGVQANALAGDESQVLENGKRYLNQFQKIGLYFKLNGMFPWLKRVYKYRMLEDKTFRFFRGLVQTSVDGREKGGGHREDFMQFLCQLKKKGASVDRLTAHALTFLLDGYDTSSMAMARVLFELAKNPSEQERLREEIQEATQGGEISFDDLIDMEYLDAVIQESLRLHPPIAILVKKCIKTLQLKHPDHGQTIEIPEGTPVLIHVAAMHLDEAYFENPEQFIPQRFITSYARKFNEECILLTFGGGPRVCLGMKFALAQIKAGVCEIIRSFKVSLDTERVSHIPSSHAHFLNYPMEQIVLNVKRI